MCLVLLYSHAFWVPQNLQINTKTLPAPHHALFLEVSVLFLEVSEPEAGQPPGEKSCLHKGGAVFPLCECWPFSSLACGQSLHLFLERGLFAQEGAPRSTLTLTAQVTLRSPRACINHRLHKKILSIMAIALPHQEGLINELQFQ